MLPIYLFSQIKIKGRVVDLSENPIEYADIFLLINDSIVKSDLSDEHGFFELKAFPGIFSLKIRQVGTILYETQINLQSDFDLGTIKGDNSISLEEVIVRSKRKVIEKQVDRIVFNVDHSISAIGGDALDLLKITPGIRVLNNELSMVGRSNMGLMLNGRLLQLSGDDLLSFIRNLKSDEIKKIEVITNPPAKYDSQGNSGLINIVTKTAMKNSFNSSFRSTLSQSKKALGSIGWALNYQKEKLTISSNISYTNGELKPSQEYNIYYPDFLWNERNTTTHYSNNIGGRFTLDYDITSKLKMGFEYSLSNNTPLSKLRNIVSMYNNSNSMLDSIIDNKSRVKTKINSHFVNYYSTLLLDSVGRKINFDVNYMYHKSNTDNNFQTNFFFADGSVKADRFYAANNQSNLDIDIITSSLDFVYPTEWINLNWGAKISFMKNNSNTVFYNKTSEDPLIDLSRSNEFKYRENLQAIYISGSKRLSKQIDLQIGLRGESVQTKGVSKTMDQTNKESYVKLFPSVYFNYTIQDDNVISFNYNRRINRPPYNLLNPFRFYSTSFNYSEGNPFLQPFFTDNFELSHIYKNNYASLYISYISDKYDVVTYVDPETIMQIVRPDNFYDQISYGIFDGYSFSINNLWESNNDCTIYYTKTRSSISNIVPSISSWSGNFTSNNMFMLNKEGKYKAEVNFSYQLPSLAGSYHLSSYYQLDLGFRANFLNEKLQISINVTDILKTNKKEFTQVVNSIKQKNFDYPERNIRFSLIYSFGKKIKSLTRKSTNDDEIKRL